MWLTPTSTWSGVTRRSPTSSDPASGSRDTTGADIAGFLGKEGWARAFEQVTPLLRPWLEQLATLPTDVPFEFDGWDAYPAARERMNRMFVETGSRPLVLSGDSHAFWVNELHDAQDRRVAAELGVTAITSSTSTPTSASTARGTCGL